jgi:hypothetical protein
MFDLQELYEETGIDNTWKNHSDSKRIAVQLQKQCMHMYCMCKVYTKLKQHRTSENQLSGELEILS